MTEDLAAVRYAHRVGLLAAANLDALRYDSYCFTGDGPFLISDLISLLPEGAEVAEDEPEAASVVVIGIDDYSEDVIRAATALDEPPKFIPQEGLIDLVLFGYDWWDNAMHELNDAADRHPGLKFVKSLADAGAFPWPSTDVEPSVGTHEALDPDLRLTSSLFDTGYRITGLTRQDRWRVLITSAIPSLGLRPVAQTIAYNVRLRKLQVDGETKYANAIREWEHDLSRLYNEYYLPNRGFPWPSLER